jgi:hypothetical protein
MQDARSGTGAKPCCCCCCCCFQDLEVQQNARGYAAVRERLQGALEGFQPAACCTVTPAAAAAAAAAGKQPAGGQWQQLGVSGKSMAAGMELCRMSKLLIISGEKQPYLKLRGC